MPTVLHVPAFEDNYIWLMKGQPTDRVLIVDPGDAGPVFDALQQHHLTPTTILCTHHHGDHVGGVDDLVDHFNITIYGPAAEAIPRCQHRLLGGETVPVEPLGLSFRVLSVPGHTLGHIAYHGHGLLFCGDTLFSAGCGRLFEGSPEQMFSSLKRLAALPDDTVSYCAHEYTEANLRFAATVEPGNADIPSHQAAVHRLRLAGKPSVPSTLRVEKLINPFLRTMVPGVRQAAERQAGRKLETELEVFTLIRRWKDNFRG